MQLSARSAQPEDISQLIQWGQALHEVERGFEPQLQFSLDDVRQQYEHELRNPQALFLVAEQSINPVGYLYAHIDPTPPYLQTKAQECVIEVIYLDPPARGTGLAELLVERCFSWARQQEIWRFSTGIYASNQSSIHLFGRLGFRPYHCTFIKEHQKVGE